MGARRDYASLGTDGFGLSDTRGALRRHFKVDAESITVADAGGAGPARRVVDAPWPSRPRTSTSCFDVTAADPGLSMGEA